MGLALDLAHALGDLDAMRSLYHDDVTMTLPASLGSPLCGPHKGIEAVCDFNAYVNSVYDPATVQVTILNNVDDGDQSAVRFLYRANIISTNALFEGEYMFFVKARDGLIVEIDERLDTLAVLRLRVKLGLSQAVD